MFTLNLKFVEVTTNRTENKINTKVIKLFSIHFFRFLRLVTTMGAIVLFAVSSKGKYHLQRQDF